MTDKLPEPLPLDVVGSLTTIVTPSASVTTAGPKTVHQEEQLGLTQMGQRRVNLLWEATQTGLAFLTLLFVGIILIIQYARGDPNPDAPEILKAILLVIVTMYYQRTNHTRIGGTGEKVGER